MKITIETLLFAAMGSLLGFSWGHGHLSFAIVIAAAFPMVLFFAPSRLAAFAFALGYFLLASRGIPHGVGVFFNTEDSPLFGWGLWIGAACLNAGPWAWAWTKEQNSATIFKILVAIGITALPPIGIVGWASPLASAGWVFPGLGVLGLAALLLLWHAVLNKNWELVIAGALLSATLNAHTIASPALSELNGISFQGLDTNFSKLQSHIPSQISSRVNLITSKAQSLAPNSVLVLPETMLPAPDSKFSFIELLLEDAGQVLRSKNSVIVFGREFKTETGMINTLAFLGTDRDPVLQRIPVPFGMWKPWVAESFNMDVFGPGSTNLAGLKLGHLICFEEVLTLTNFMTFIDQPDIVVSSANDWWARETSIPAVQEQTVGAWGRLFGSLVVRAVNL